jgi:adenylosuccinate lyase
MAAVRAGVGRETAHEVIKEHAVAVALGMRAGGTNDLYDRLAADARLGLSRDQLGAVDPLELTGSARAQVDAIAARVAELAVRFPDGAAYTPGAVL